MILKNKEFFTDMLVSIILTNIFLIISIKLTLNFKLLYYWDIKNLSIIENTDLNLEEIKENFKLPYLLFKFS